MYYLQLNWFRTTRIEEFLEFLTRKKNNVKYFQFRIWFRLGLKIPVGFVRTETQQ